MSLLVLADYSPLLIHYCNGAKTIEMVSDLKIKLAKSSSFINNGFEPM